jgi:hypothetical protein
LPFTDTPQQNRERRHLAIPLYNGGDCGHAAISPNKSV